MPDHSKRYRELWLLLATFLVAISGLIYELIAATLSSYLLGDSIRQFSLVIGVFLSSMGVGAWLSRFVKNSFDGFIWAQVSLGIIGGAMAPVLFFIFAWNEDVTLPLYGMLMLIGLLSGMEIPLIARLMEQFGALKFRFENVLSVDYIGALVASLAFPFLVIPHLGLMSASLAFGALNLLVAGLSLWIFRDLAKRVQIMTCIGAFMITVFGVFQSEQLVTTAEAMLFEDDVIVSEATPYQQITVTKYQDRVRLFLDHSIQFDSLDEHRYHEPLVHPAMALSTRRNHILVLGGGDGMALREILKYDDVETVTLVDLDPRVTELFSKQPTLAAINNRAFHDPRVQVINTDAWKFAAQDQNIYDVIIVDLPDPKSVTLSKLYTRQFYGILIERLSAQGYLVTQAGSPFFAREAFWSIAKTLKNTRNPQDLNGGLYVLPYHSYVPSFGDWGFVMARLKPIQNQSLTLPKGLKTLTQSSWEAAQVFPQDTAIVDVFDNSLQSHALLQYYLEGWDYWFR
jgi:spermidine synthase